MKSWRIFGVLFAVGGGGIVMGCQALINIFTFFPDRGGTPDPAELPAGMAEVFIPAADGERLQCYYLAQAASRTLVIYFHGNAGHIGHRIPELQRLAAMGLNVLGVGYRGYGKSTGRPSEAGVYADGAAALRYGQERLGFSLAQIILMGRSLGSSVAVEVARGRPLQAVVLITPFTSGQAMGRLIGLGPLARLAGAAFDSLSKIRELRAPLLIVHGTADEVVPLHMGQTLYAAAPHPKHFIAVPNGMHNDLEIAAATLYWNAILTFIQGLSTPPGQAPPVR